MIELALLMLATPLALFGAGIALGAFMTYLKTFNPIVKEAKRALKRNGALGIIFRKDGTCQVRAVDLQGSYIVDEKGERMWEVRRMQVVRKSQNPGEVIVELGTDKPALLNAKGMRMPVYVLVEDACATVSNPSLIVLDPAAVASTISASALFDLKRKAEVVGMYRERSKMRDAMFYATIFVAMAVVAVVLVSALKMAFGG